MWNSAFGNQNAPVRMTPRDTSKLGVPIKKVRIMKRDATIECIREGKPGEAHVKPAATHHLCIFEWELDGKMKRDAVFVTQLKAINRIKLQQQEMARRTSIWNREGLPQKAIDSKRRHALREIAQQHPIIERDPRKLEHADRERIPPNARFVMSLSKNELILLEINGTDTLYAYNTAAATTRQMTFYPHTAARHGGAIHGKLTKYPASLFQLNPRKVTVDPLGRIRWAND
jgi:hypothetical protein